MALKRKQNSSRPSEMTSNTNSNQAAVTCKHKHSGIRGFLQILPFLQCFKQKIKSIEKTSLHKTKPSSSLNDHDIRKLIRLYEGHENLYNPRHADYGDVNYDDACFSIIASYFPSRSSAELKNCINELRLLFEREYIIIENGYRRFGELLQPTIKYYHEFMFLVPFLRFYWDSGLYLPPKESSTDDGVSQNSCTSDGTDRTMPSCVDLTGVQLKRPTGGKCLFFGKKNAKQKTEDRKSKEDKMKEEEQSMENKVTEDYYTSEHDQLTTSSSQLQLPSPRRSLHKTDEESSPKQCKITCNGGQRLTSRPETPAEANSRPSIPSHSVQGAQSSAKASNASRHSVNEAESQARASNASHHSVNGAQGKARVSNASRHSVNAAENKSRLSNASRHPEPAAERNSRTSNASRQSVQEAQSTARASNASRHSVNENKSRPSVASQSCCGSTDRAPYYCAQSASATQEQHYSACSSQPIYPGNREQLEMLCEMIKLELSVAPDFIYYDAKWRIIEILREVQKRKSIHCRAEPGPRGQTVQHPASGQQPMSSNLPQQQPGQEWAMHCNQPQQDPQCICHSPANCCQREPTNCCNSTRIRCPAQAKRCPYCCKR